VHGQDTGQRMKKTDEWAPLVREREGTDSGGGVVGPGPKTGLGRFGPRGLFYFFLFFAFFSFFDSYFYYNFCNKASNDFKPTSKIL
jgi:hypothetical protein